MNPAPAEHKEILAVLARTPRRIASLIGGVEDPLLRRRPAADAWSVSDILAHLRACADVWGKGILAMISTDHPALRHVSPRSWIRKTDYAELDVHASLDAYAAQRRDLLAGLRALAAKDWSRSATITGTTRPRDETVTSYALRISQHEEKHLDQIARTLKAVGAP
jgi:hypothetical protein